MELGIREVKLNFAKNKNLVIENAISSIEQHTQAVSCPMNVRHEANIAFGLIEDVNFITSSQKIHQCNALELAEKSSQKKSSNSLEEIRELMYSFVYLGEEN